MLTVMLPPEYLLKGLRLMVCLIASSDLPDFSVTSCSRPSLLESLCSYACVKPPLGRFVVWVAPGEAA